MSGAPDRPGDVRLVADPAKAAGEAHLVFIGRVRSAHARGEAAPKNPAKAREQGQTATLEIDAQFRPGLEGLAAFSHIIVLGWLDAADRGLIQITRPGSVAAPSVAHQQPARGPTGVFALRSPVRPNPISVSVARLISVDVAEGRVTIDASDLLDGTPLIDIKPYRPGIDAIPDAVVP